MNRSLGSRIAICVLAGLSLRPMFAQSTPQAVPSPSPKLAPFQGSKTPREIAQAAFPSVVILVLQDSKGQPTSLGSGFVLRDGLVVTNRHVIEGAASGYSRIVGAGVKYTIAGTAAVDAAHDLAIVAVNGLKAPALPIVGDDSEVAVGDDVYAIGNPQGLEGTFSQGIVSAVRRVGSDTLFQMTSPISPGSSGGPILNNRGHVIGIAVATFTGGQNLNLAIPSSYVVALAANVSSDVSPLSRLRATSEKSSIVSGLGEPSVHGVLGEHFVWGVTSGFTSEFTFSLRNQLQQAVKDVSYLVIFFGGDHIPIDVSEGRFADTIPAGLAKRQIGEVDPSVHYVWQQTVGGQRGNVEIRILDFRLAE